MRDAGKFVNGSGSAALDIMPQSNAAGGSFRPLDARAPLIEGPNSQSETDDLATVQCYTG